MEHGELLGYILNGTLQERRDWIEPLLCAWIKESAQFKEFIDNDRHRNKIRSKLQGNINEQDFTDKPWFEIKVIYLFFKNFNDLISEIIYEEKEVGPDIKVVIRNNGFFHAEIKRIRRYPVEVAYENLVKFLNNVKFSFNQSQIGMGINGQIRITNQDFRDENFAERLKNNDYRARLVAFLKEKLSEVERTGFFNSLGYNFENNIIIEFSWFQNPTSAVSFCSGSTPFFEFSTTKIISDISEKSAQIVPNEQNLIVIGTDEECFDKLHFERAVKALKGCNKCLNGVLFKCWGSRWHFWYNEKSDKPFPIKVRRILESFSSI